MKKYAFLIMGAEYDPSRHHAEFETPHGLTCIRTVRTAEEARREAERLHRDGFGALELCGAFGPEMAAELSALTGGAMAVGYVTHDPAQHSLFAAFFGS